MGPALLTVSCQDAIAAHAEWRTRLVQAIVSGTSLFSVEEAAAPDRCALGKWLLDTPANEDDLAAVKALHAAFHQCAGEVLAHALACDLARAEARLHGDFASLSDDLVRALVALSQRARGPHGA